MHHDVQVVGEDKEHSDSHNRDKCMLRVFMWVWVLMCKHCPHSFHRPLLHLLQHGFPHFVSPSILYSTPLHSTLCLHSLISYSQTQARPLQTNKPLNRCRLNILPLPLSPSNPIPQTSSETQTTDRHSPLYTQKLFNSTCPSVCIPKKFQTLSLPLSLSQFVVRNL